MKYKILILVGSFILSLSALSLTIQKFPARANFQFEPEGAVLNGPGSIPERQHNSMQVGAGTPTVAYYLPLLKADAPLATQTPTPTLTPTPTQVQVWYGEGIYDDIHPGIDYSVDWSLLTVDTDFHRTLHQSNEQGNEVMFHFSGSQISVFYSKGANRGNMEIWIDGALVDTIDQYSLDLEPQHQWNSPQLTDTTHTIILRHVSGEVVNLDALIVSDYAYPPGPGVPPLFSKSYYLNTIDSNNLYDLGCELGTNIWDIPGWQDSLVVLDFGMPREWDGNYGASLFGVSPATTSQLREAVKWFGLGYYICSMGENQSHLRIAVGTSNYYKGQVTYNHGRQWAILVNEINAYFSSQGLSGRMDAVGANDMELGWNTPEVTRAWVGGYDSINLYPLYNFGDAAGCPTYTYTWWTCSGMGDWTKEDVWYISYGAPPSYPLPLIYADSGVNAEQWHLLSIYSYENHGTAMEVQGEMTQYLACLQLGGCDPLDNTPAEGWTYLWTYLNNDPRTAQDLRYSTDILYHWLLE